jgi:hypothetical protein
MTCRPRSRCLSCTSRRKQRWMRVRCGKGRRPLCQSLCRMSNWKRQQRLRTTRLGLRPTWQVSFSLRASDHSILEAMKRFRATVLNLTQCLMGSMLVVRRQCKPSKNPKLERTYNSPPNTTKSLCLVRAALVTELSSVGTSRRGSSVFSELPQSFTAMGEQKRACPRRNRCHGCKQVAW